MVNLPEIMIFLNFGHIHPLMFVVIVHFWSCSDVKVRRCEFFGHVQIFWSYSFSHLESVKWLFLKNIYEPLQQQHFYFKKNNERNECQTFNSYKYLKKSKPILKINFQINSPPFWQDYLGYYLTRWFDGWSKTLGQRPT